MMPCTCATSSQEERFGSQPRQKNIFVFFTSQVSFLHLPKKNLRLGAVNLQLLVFFFTLFSRNWLIFEKLIAPNWLVLRN